MKKPSNIGVTGTDVNQDQINQNIPAASKIDECKTEFQYNEFKIKLLYNLNCSSTNSSHKFHLELRIQFFDTEGK